MKEKKAAEDQVPHKPLALKHDRICECSANQINCGTPKDWVKSQVAIWEFYYEGRDVRDKNIHPAAFPISLPSRCIELFTHRGQLILDPFVGTGSTLIAAQDLNRNAVGFDLNRQYLDFAQSRLSQSTLFGKSVQQLTVEADAKEIPAYLEPESVSLCVTSPPYANMLNRNHLNKTMRSDLRQNEHFLRNLQYSNDARDLGTLQTQDYVTAIGDIFRGIFPLLRPKAHCVINVNDLWENNRRTLLHMLIIQALEAVGYELRNIIVWDKRNLVNKIGIYGWPNNFITFSITFEYILDFWKPA